MDESIDGICVSECVSLSCVPMIVLIRWAMMMRVLSVKHERIICWMRWSTHTEHTAHAHSTHANEQIPAQMKHQQEECERTNAWVSRTSQPHTHMHKHTHITCITLHHIISHTCFLIDWRCCFIHHHHLTALKQRTCHTDQLTLTHREVTPTWDRSTHTKHAKQEWIHAMDGWMDGWLDWMGV